MHFAAVGVLLEINTASGVLVTGRVRPAERQRIRAATHPSYRPDIDGLRALAVVPVVFSHFGIPGFAGGYVGVDVFFVISGYLITGILVRDLAVGRHSITEFYRRRILRIFPVLFAVIAATTILACLWMFPVELLRYARAAASSALFSSNILFYYESGYFDSLSDAKPLLHTWSLSIEEQFYILWPLLLALVGAHRPRGLKLTVLMVCVLSFAASAILVGTNPSATFYLLPTRCWELALGALLALTGNPVRARWLNGLLGVLGLTAVLLAVWLYDSATQFPGTAALLPCLGASLLIATGSKGTFVGRLLSVTPAVFIGKISYSLYMWHWPVFVFSKMTVFYSGPNSVTQAAQILLCLVLAVFSWKFIECPFRQNVNHWRTSRILLAGLAAMLVTVGIAAALVASRGLPGRFSPEEQAVAAYLDMDVEKAYRRGTCFRTSPRSVPEPDCLVPKSERPVVLLLGDSHAAHLWPGFAARNSGYEVLQATMAGCRPIIQDSPSGACRRMFSEMLSEWVPRNHPDLVVLAAKWQPKDLDLLDRTLGAPALRGQKILLIGPIPQYSREVPRLVALAMKNNDPELLRRAQIDMPFALDKVMRATAERHGVSYVSLIDMLCRNRTCRTLAAPDIPLQFDYGHLTEEGSGVVVAGISPSIERALGIRAPRNAPSHGANNE